MTDQQAALLYEIADGQRRILAMMDHALAGPPEDRGPRKGWLREVIADVKRLTHPLLMVQPGELPHV
jgi:hypothetical protein